jgi:hypothetical protein
MFAVQDAVAKESSALVDPFRAGQTDNSPVAIDPWAAADPIATPANFSALLGAGSASQASRTILVADESPSEPATLLEQPSLPSEKQKLGQAPEDFSHQFLRQESVLLKPGEWRLDTGVNYTVFDHNYTNLGIIDVNGQSQIVALDSRIARRLLMAPLDLRFGICEQVQGFVDVPFGWSNIEDGYAGFDDFENKAGIGDVSAGVSWQIRKSCGRSSDPDIIATFAFTAPTADVNPLQGILDPPNTLLGQGFWFGAWNVLFIHTIDPVVVFYGFGSRHAITREYYDWDVRYGDQYIYRAGLGFSVNERVTLSTSVIGSYITAPQLQGRHIEGLSMEPISMRFGATIINACSGHIWDPFVEIGMTPDSPNARIGLTYTF